MQGTALLWLTPDTEVINNDTETGVAQDCIWHLLKLVTGWVGGGGWGGGGGERSPGDK